MAKKKIRSVSASRATCTDIGHKWAPYDGGRKGKGWFRVLWCPTCDTFRHQELDRHGDITKQWYRFKGDYLVKGGRLTHEEKSAIRLHNMMETIPGAKESV